MKGGCKLQLVEAGNLKRHICYTKSRIRANTRKGSAVSWGPEGCGLGERAKVARRLCARTMLSTMLRARFAHKGTMPLDLVPLQGE